MLRLTKRVLWVVASAATVAGSGREW